MNAIARFAATIIALASLWSTARTDDGDEQAAQSCIERFMEATKKGDVAAMTALLEPAAQEKANRDREKPDPWPEGSTWTTLHRHVEGDWGLFWARIDYAENKGTLPSYLTKEENAALRKPHSQTTPALVHRVDGKWCFVYAGFAPAEIELIFHGRPEKAPTWIVRDYLDWVVESWRKSPDVHPIELDKPSDPVEVTPDRPTAFLVDLKTIIRLRAVVTSDSDVEPSVSIESPAGGSYGSRGTPRRCVGTCQFTKGAILLVVAAKRAGKVVVEASAAPNPTRLDLGGAAGPFRVRPADDAEFTVRSQDSKDVAFLAVPLSTNAAGFDFRVTTVTPRTETGTGGPSTVATVKGSTTFRLGYRGHADVDVLAAAVAMVGEPDVSADRAAELDLEPGKPRFLRLSASDADAAVVLTGASPDARVGFVCCSAGDEARRVAGLIVYSAVATHVSVALARR